MLRFWVANAVACLGAVLASGSLRAADAGDPADVFALPGEANIVEEEHFGIVNGMATVGIPFKSVAAVSGLFAPPWVSSDFRLALSVGGRNVATDRYVWHPYAVSREGSTDGLRVRTAATLVPGFRGGRMTVAIDNPSDQTRDVSLQWTVGGTLDRTAVWEFARPASHSATQPIQTGASLLLAHGEGALAIAWTAATQLQKPSGVLQPIQVSLAPHATWLGCVVFAVGSKAEAANALSAIGQHPETSAERWEMTPPNARDAKAAKPVCRADETYRRHVADVFEKLPRLRSNSAALVRLYNRSLVHLITNRWEVPEFLLHPYYGTGSVKGGCVCNYLWNFGETWEILPLVDPAAVRDHVKQFLKIDMTKHFAFMPITGEAFGPWYPVNQEKIIGLVYYYVQQTGDVDFLRQPVDGRSVLDHVVANAMFGDDPSKPMALIDYGPSNSHLELRRGYPYNHVMPDLNGRRYANYLMASQLAEVAGKPNPLLRQRAEALRTVLKQSLWNPKQRWFDFQDAQGRKDARYTIQIFKLFGSEVLDAEEEAGLLGHLNEREFLSEFGLHSLAKTDVAYDQVDIDNGGGGACTCFPPQIAERLYKAGRPEPAADLLRRILWWGECLPYWGDSLVANSRDYRKDTPLQCTVDGVTVAQCLLFGMLGASADFSGEVTIDPRPPAWASRLEVVGLRLRGQRIDVAVHDGEYEVRVAGRTLRGRVGQPVVIPRAVGHAL